MCVVSACWYGLLILEEVILWLVFVSEVTLINSQNISYIPHYIFAMWDIVRRVWMNEYLNMSMTMKNETHAYNICNDIYSNTVYIFCALRYCLNL